MTKKQLLWVVILNLGIGIGFFISNIGGGYERLSSDLHNIVPMCMKFDQPSLYAGDLYAGDIDNFKYYTPFFVKTLRFFGFITQGNYVQALNILLLMCHLLFGLLWFYLFFKVFDQNFLVALFLSIFIRGIVWLPGFEIWGISDIWSLMPRTVYATLLPLPFILLLRNRKSCIWWAAFLIGFIFNFHPITGLGGVLMFFVFLFCLKYFFKKDLSYKKIMGMGMASILGMLPFLFTYFLKTEVEISYDRLLYNEAFAARIPDFFSSPYLFMKKWLSPKFLFFALPFVFYLFVGFWKRGIHQKRALTLMVLLFFIVLLPNVSAYLESLINKTFGLNFRMAFQLIRIQKLAILIPYFSIGFLILTLLEMKPILKRMFPFLLGTYILVALASSSYVISNVPFFSDDITKGIFPNFKGIFLGTTFQKTDFDLMSDYIQKNTPPESIFFGNYMLRSAAKRSVVLDNKGASILIEGNPKGLITWFQHKKVLKQLPAMEKVKYLKEMGVSYILTKGNGFAFLNPTKEIGTLKLYALP